MIILLKANTKLLIFIIVIIVVAISGCTSNDGSSVKLTSPIENCKMVNVPYQEQVAYTEKEPYTANENIQVPLKYEVTSAVKDTTFKGFDVWAYGEVTVRNVDTETGTFIVEQTITTLNSLPSTKRSSHYIMPGESKNFREEYDIKSGEDYNIKYTVEAGTKTVIQQVTKYRTITKYRTETKYKQEEQCN